MLGAFRVPSIFQRFLLLLLKLAFAGVLLFFCSCSSSSSSIEPPAVDVPAGFYSKPLLVKLVSSTNGTSLYWRQKGESEWSLYTEPIPIFKSTTLQSYASKNGANSHIIELSYILNLEKEGILENHGIALTSISTYAGLFTQIPDIGKVYYGVTRSGDYARFFRYNVSTEKVDIVHSLPDAKGGWGIVASNGFIYIGTYLNPHVYRYDISRDKIEKIFDIVDASYVWDMKVRDNVLYVGTYPKAIIYKYNLVTGELTKYQNFTSGAYVRSLDVYNNKIYAGIGPKAELVEYDMGSDTYRNILPPENAGDSFAYDVQQIDGKLFVGLSPSYTILQYDFSKKIFKTLIGNSFTSKALDAPTIGENFVHFSMLGILFQYDRQTGEMTRILPADLLNFELVASHLDASGKVIGIVPQGLYREYSHSGEILKNVDFMTAGLPGLPDYPMSIAAYDDAVFIDGIRLRKYAPAAKTEQYGLLMGEVKSMCFLGSSLLTANYPTAKIWEFTAETLRDVTAFDMRNSRYNILSVNNSQTRPKKIVADFSTKSFLVGTEPEYGQYGGALTYYNFRTHLQYTQRNIVPNHTIQEVIYDSTDKAIAYLGTSSYGGTGTAILKENAHIIKWDIISRKILFDIIPENENIIIFSLASDGVNIFAVTGNQNLYKIDSSTGEIVAGKLNSGLIRILNSVDGNLYGVSYTTLYRINRNDLTLTPLKSGFNSISALTEDEIGNKLYIVDGYDLISYK